MIKNQAHKKSSPLRALSALLLVLLSVYPVSGQGLVGGDPGVRYIVEHGHTAGLSIDQRQKKVVVSTTNDTASNGTVTVYSEFNLDNLLLPSGWYGVVDVEPYKYTANIAEMSQSGRPPAYTLELVYENDVIAFFLPTYGYEWGVTERITGTDTYTVTIVMTDTLLIYAFLPAMFNE